MAVVRPFKAFFLPHVDVPVSPESLLDSRDTKKTDLFYVKTGLLDSLCVVISKQTSLTSCRTYAYLDPAWSELEFVCSIQLPSASGEVSI